MFQKVELVVLMKICISCDSDFGAEPHSVSTPSKGTVLFEKIKHFIGLDDSVLWTVGRTTTARKKIGR
jgi:hypothetical protein